MPDMSDYLNTHNLNEHNFHTNWEDKGFDVCLECDLVRHTGGLYLWKEEELV